MKKDSETAGPSAPARVADRAGRFPKPIDAGSIVIIDIADLDAETAHQLSSMAPVAVLNAASSVSGRAPALGAQTLIDQGILLVDDFGPDLMGVQDGQTLTVSGDTVYYKDSLVASGNVVTWETLQKNQVNHSERVARKVEAAAATAATAFRAEAELLDESIDIPQLRELFEGRPAVVATPSAGPGGTIGQLKALIQTYDPVLVGVGAGAGAYSQVRRHAQILVGNPQDFPEDAVAKAKVIVAVSPGEAGLEVLRRNSREAVIIETELSAADIAFLIAQASGASVVIDASASAGLEEALDQASIAAAGSLLVQAKVRDTLLSWQAAKALYRPPISTWLLVALLLAAVLAGLTALLFTPFGDSLLPSFGAQAGAAALRPWGIT